MKLTERLGEGRVKKAIESVATNTGAVPTTLSSTIKARLHALVIDKLDLSNVAESDAKKLREKVRPTVEAICAADPEAQRLPEDQRIVLAEGILDEIAGLGPLENLVGDPSISDILVNNAEQVFVERGGKLELTGVKFTDNAHLLNIIQRIVSRVGRRVDESSPMVDARLPDGSRVNAVVPPVAPDGAILSIRRFGKRMLNPNDFIQRGVCTAAMMKFLAAAVHSKCNTLVSGGTGAGKTTLLNLLSSFIPKHERVITIEDSLELSLQGHHVVRMEARPPNLEGRGEVTIRACVKNALRMRPDRIIIGEVRSAEVLDLLQAMNTGHEGSMGTVHANTPNDAVDRLMMMLALSEVSLSNETMGKFIANSVRVIVQVARFADGARRITHISEVGEYSDAENVPVKHIFTYNVQQQRFIFHGGSSLESRFLDHGVKLNLGPPDP